MANELTKHVNSPEIAEIMGAFIGDGWIESDKNAIYITGSPTEDRSYYETYLAPLFSKNFTLVTPKNFKYWGVFGITSYKKEVIEKAINLGFQTGPKALIAEIPKEVLQAKNREVIVALIRGIFDTDGCFWCDKSRTKTSSEWKRTYNYQPQLGISSCSKTLLEQIQFLLNKLGIESKIRKKTKKGFKNGRNNQESYGLEVRKRDEIEKWFRIIGTKNPRHITRYEVWKKLGYLPPNTTIEERLNILS